MTEEDAVHYIKQFFAGRPNVVVLFVDDYKNARIVGLLLLHELGLTNVLLAQNGEEALRFYREHGPETIKVVVSDYHMPELTGEQLFWRLKQENDGIRMVLCSGDDSPPPRLDAMVKSGLRGYLEKPFEKGELAKKLAYALS